MDTLYRKNYNSEEFKKDVMELHEQGYTPIQIAHDLAEKYNINRDSLGSEYTNFRSRVRNCISRNKN